MRNVCVRIGTAFSLHINIVPEQINPFAPAHLSLLSLDDGAETPFGEEQRTAHGQTCRC